MYAVAIRDESTYVNWCPPECKHIATRRFPRHDAYIVVAHKALLAREYVIAPFLFIATSLGQSAITLEKRKANWTLGYSAINDELINVNLY